MDIEKIKEQIIKNRVMLGTVGAILIIVAVFVPFIKFSTPAMVSDLMGDESYTYILIGIGELVDDLALSIDNPINGVFILIFEIIALIIIFADKISEKVNESIADKVKKLANSKFVLIPTILSIIVLIRNVSIAKDVEDLSMGFTVLKLKFGFWLIIIGVILSGIYVFFDKDTSSNTHKNSNNIKETVEK